MANILSSVTTNLLTGLTKAGADVVAEVSSFVSSSLVSWTADELAIFGNATTAMIQAVEAGQSWDNAVTAAYNLFYNQESAEGTKIGLAFLNLLAQLAQTAEADVSGTA